MQQDYKAPNVAVTPNAAERSALFSELKKWYKERRDSELKLQNLLQDTTR